MKVPRPLTLTTGTRSLLAFAHSPPAVSPHKNPHQKIVEKSSPPYSHKYPHCATVIAAMSRLILCALSFTLLCSQAMPAQNTLFSTASLNETPPPATDLTNLPTATLNVDARMVSIDAVVRDSHGDPIHNLTREAFLLNEDGKPVTIRYFDRDDDLPLTVGLLIDTSASQRAFLSSEALAGEVFLRNTLTHPTDRAFITLFDSNIQTFQRMTSSLDELHDAMRRMTFHGDPRQQRNGGGTLLFDAISAASYSLVAHQAGRRALVILTDGNDNGSDASLSEVIRQAQFANVAIYSILYTNEDPRPHLGNSFRPSGITVMRELSRTTGGRQFLISKTTSIAQIFSSIADDLRNEYRLGLTPTDTQPAKFHSLKLKSTEKGLTIQARTGYYTPW